MKKFVFILLACLGTTAAMASSWLTNYMPLNDDDELIYKMTSSGTNYTNTVTVRANNTYPGAFLRNSKTTGTNYNSGVVEYCKITNSALVYYEIKSSSTDLIFTNPPLKTITDEALETYSTLGTYSNFVPFTYNNSNWYSAVFGTVGWAGPVLVPAGVFQNCLSVTQMTYYYLSNSYATNLFSMSTQYYVLAPQVGVIQSGSDTNKSAWFKLLSGSIDGVDVTNLHGTDTNLPTMTLSSPATGKKLITNSLSLYGTAKDDVSIGQIISQIGDDYFWWTNQTTTNGTIKWTNTVQLNPGSNWIQTWAVDSSGNSSKTNSIAAWYLLTDRLTLITNGSGGIKRSFSGLVLVLSNKYSLTAAPATGYILSNWVIVSNLVTTTETETNISLVTNYSTNNTLKFVMESNTTITANFVPNPFLTNKGTYSGLIVPVKDAKLTNLQSSTNIGLLSLTLANKGTYTAKVLIGGGSYSISGSFTLAGDSYPVIKRKNLPSLVGYLRLNYTNQAITGVVTNGTNESAVFAFLGTSTTNAHYTVTIPGNGTNADSTPAGDGCMTVSVNTKGAAKISGILADGAKFTQSTTVSKNGGWPLYASLYKKSGLIAGYQIAVSRYVDGTDFYSMDVVTNTTNSDIYGGLIWWANGSSTYSSGFVLETNVTGSLYTYAKGTNILSFTNDSKALAEFSCAGVSLTNEVTLTNNVKFVVDSSATNKLTLKLTTGTGLLTGSFRTDSGAKTTFNSVVLQRQNTASGFFINSNHSGLFQLNGE